MALITCPDCGNKVSNLARSCIKCGRPMNSSAPGAPLAQPQSATPAAPVPPPAAGPRKTSLFTWLVVAIVVALVFKAVVEERGRRIEGHPGTETATAAEKPASKPIMDVDPAVLLGNYEDNEVSTNDKMRGYLLRVTGYVDEISEMFGPVLKIETGVKFHSLRAHLEDSSRAAAARLHVHDKVTILCERASFVMGDPSLGGCVII